MVESFGGNYALKRWGGYVHFVFTYCFITTHINKPCIKTLTISMMFFRFGIPIVWYLEGFMLVNIHRKKMRCVNNRTEHHLNVWREARNRLRHSTCVHYTAHIIVLIILAVVTHRSYCSWRNEKCLSSKQSLTCFMRCCLPDSSLSSDLLRPQCDKCDSVQFG